MMKEETQDLKTIQDQIHSIMIDFCDKFAKKGKSKIVVMNLSTISKELNSMINESIIGDSIIEEEI